MSSLAGRIGARALPHGWGDLVRQVALFAAAYYAYLLVRGTIDGRSAVAFANAAHLVALESRLHVFVEPAVQAWAAHRPPLLDVASWLYVNVHFVLTAAALVWLYVFRNRSFYFVRNMFLVSMALALVAYATWPVAPPRLVPGLGFEDSVRRFTGVDDAHGPASALVNLYAAVPSMHVAFACMVGWPLARLARRPLLRAAWALYPLLVIWVVVATGNHFLADVVLGVLTAGASALIAQWLLARARPAAWTFRSAEVPA